MNILLMSTCEKLPDDSYAWVLADPWIKIFKDADESHNNTTTLAPDSKLTFSLAANTKYHFRCEFFYDTSAAADFKWRHSGPAGASLIRIRSVRIGPGQSIEEDLTISTDYSATDNVILETTGVGGWVQLDGIIHNGATAGAFSIKWAQNTSGSGPTTVRAGSWLEYREMLP